MAVDKLARKKIPIIGALAGAWYRSLDRQGLQASAGVVAITEDFIPILAGLGVPQEKITVIPNWAPLEEVPLRPRQNNWSTQHGLDDKFVFLYSGTLAMKHDPDLLRRLAIQFSDDPAVRLVVVSEGPGADYLQDCKMNEGLENLVLLPFQPFEVLPDTLATANVMVAVLESDAGVFSVPSKVLTYHAAGRPILGSIPGGNLAARIIRRQESGICVDPGSGENWESAAKRLRVSETLRTAMARNARAYAEKEFDIVSIADRFESAFAAALSSKR